MIAAGTIVCLAGCVYFAKHTAHGACKNDLSSPIRNFCADTRNVWRGERPRRDEASWLLEHGVGTIVNLEVFLSDRVAFEHSTPPPGIFEVPYFHLPDFEPLHLVNWSLLDEHVAKFVAIIETQPKPVYVHCLDGIDRAGVLKAAYSVLIDNVDPESAIAEMARFGSPWIRVDGRYIRSLTGEHRDTVLRRAAAWKSRLKPSARISCDRGTCRYQERGTRG